MIPPCYNRPPRADWYTANSHVDYKGHQQRKVIPVVFIDRCATWDGRGIGPNGEPYPVAHGYECASCKWLPASVTLPSIPNSGVTP